MKLFTNALEQNSAGTCAQSFIEATTSRARESGFFYLPGQLNAFSGPSVEGVTKAMRCHCARAADDRENLGHETREINGLGEGPQRLFCDNAVPANDVLRRSQRGPAPFVTKISLAERFWAKVDKSGDCWIWLGDRDAKGYGHFLVGSRATKRKLLQAHRVAYELTYGSTPPLLRHMCGNTSCVRPDHLKPGTQAENMADMVRMGRSLVGTTNPASKLTEARVRSIFARIQAGEANLAIARTEGVSGSTVWQIENGLMWTHITGVARRIPKRDRRKDSARTCPSPTTEPA